MILNLEKIETSLEIFFNKYTDLKIIVKGTNKSYLESENYCLVIPEINYSISNKIKGKIALFFNILKSSDIRKIASDLVTYIMNTNKGEIPIYYEGTSKNAYYMKLGDVDSSPIANIDKGLSVKLVTIQVKL